MRLFDTALAFAAAQDETLGPTDWIEITQTQITKFAEVTGDRQWIHVDVERARREMPGGRTIAHGFLTLSLIVPMLSKLYAVKGSQVVNLGTDRFRLLRPVMAGSRIRLSAKVMSSEVASGGIKVRLATTLDLDGSDRPALVAELILLYFD